MLMAGFHKKAVDADTEAMGKALGIWAKRNNITPRQFEEKMGWRYNHAFNVLRGKYPFSPEAWGKFIKAFGVEAFQEVARIAKVELAGKKGDSDV